MSKSLIDARRREALLGFEGEAKPIVESVESSKRGPPSEATGR